MPLRAARTSAISVFRALRPLLGAAPRQPINSLHPRTMTQELLLSEFPQQLADLAQQLHEADKVIRQQQHQLDTLTAEIEQAIASDHDLKNEQQRKAKRLELTTRTAYQQAQAALQTAQDERHQLHIQYRLIADRFTVAKLITRERIASLELAA
jgi:uncharacterized phage infection (PIP) family protein YhgE